jgi:hypothetical protein
MQVLRILPFDSLSEVDLADLRGFIADLGDELEDAGVWLEQDLVVYVTNETEVELSAPDCRPAFVRDSPGRPDRGDRMDGHARRRDESSGARPRHRSRRPRCAAGP